MQPICQVSIDGQAASPVLSDRILSCQVVDKEGSESDTTAIVLNNAPPAAVPRTGAVIRVWLGYQGAVAYMGSFVAEEIELALGPDLMTITGRAASMKGSAKTPKSRHWDATSIGDIVRELAGEHGLGAAVDQRIGAFVYPYIAQTDETDYAFLERLARRHGALFSVKDGKAIFAVRASGLSPTGAALTGLTITRNLIVAGSGSFRISDRASYREVIASYGDQALGTRAEVSVPSDPQGTASARIVEPFGTRAEAEAAATARAAELLRRRSTFNVSIVGNPAARAGAPIVFPDAPPGAAGVRFVIGQATHAFNKAGGYTTGLSGEQQ